MIKADTHLLGSRAGYQTLARSSGISDGEDGEPSVLGFGQSGDPAFLASLDNDACAYGRLLQSGRYAITRVFRGNPDDAGRPTLEFRSIVVRSSDAESIMAGEADYVINDATLWREAAFVDRGTVSLPPPPQSQRTVEREDIVLFDAWLTATAGSSLAVVPSEGRSAMVRLPQVLARPDRLAMRWGLRMLSPSAPVDICTLAPSASRSGRRRLAQVDFAASESATAVVQMLPAAIGVGIRHLPPVASLRRATYERSLSRSDGEQLTLPSPSHFRQRKLVAVSIFAVALLGAIIAGVSFWGSRGEHRDQVAANSVSPMQDVGNEASPSLMKPDVADALAPTTSQQSTIDSDKSESNARRPPDKEDENRRQQPSERPDDSPGGTAIVDVPNPPQPSPATPPDVNAPSTDSTASNPESLQDQVRDPLPKPGDSLGDWLDGRLKPRVEALKRIDKAIKRSEEVDRNNPQRPQNETRSLKNARLEASKNLAECLPDACKALINDVNQQGVRHYSPKNDDTPAVAKLNVQQCELFRSWLDVAQIACQYASSHAAADVKSESSELELAKREVDSALKKWQARLEQLKSKSETKPATQPEGANHE